MSLAFVLDHTALILFAGEEEQVNALSEPLVHSISQDIASLD